MIHCTKYRHLRMSSNDPCFLLTKLRSKEQSERDRNIPILACPAKFLSQKTWKIKRYSKLTRSGSLGDYVVGISNIRQDFLEFFTL